MLRRRWSTRSIDAPVSRSGFSRASLASAFDGLPPPEFLLSLAVLAGLQEAQPVGVGHHGVEGLRLAPSFVSSISTLMLFVTF
jgi:hypothetical protein